MKQPRIRLSRWIALVALGLIFAAASFLAIFAVIILGLQGGSDSV